MQALQTLGINIPQQATNLPMQAGTIPATYTASQIDMTTIMNLMMMMMVIVMMMKMMTQATAQMT